MLKKIIACASALMPLSFASLSCASHSPEAVRHTIDISVNIAERTVTGTDKIALRKDTARVSLLLRSKSGIDRILIDGKELAFDIKEHPEQGLKEALVDIPPSTKDQKYITVHFHGTFGGMADAQEKIKRGVAYLDDGVIAEEGVFLPSSAFWYPQQDDTLTVFDATVTLLEGYSTVMEGELVEKSASAGKTTERWKEWKPVDGADLVAGKYVVEKDGYKGVDIYTFFFKKDDELSATYIKKTKEYLDLYQSLIGPYPFKKFAVVENFLPTGYGMPSFTLLGSSVIRLPFIPDTSLGHEIAHNWWGNSVFIDSSLGNWAEALTTYTADYLYERNKGGPEAREFREKKLRAYKNFAAGRDISLREFRDSTTTASRSAGYNKGLMFFNMLEDLIGEKDFKAGLKEFYSGSAFQKASWADIQKAFESSSEKDLGWFFEQWLARAGGPSLSVKDAGLKKTGNGYAVTFKVTQAGEPYILDLPVLFRTDKGEVWKSVRVKDAEGAVAIELPSRPVSFDVDPDYRVFRIFSDEEVPATFAGFFGDKDGVIVMPNRNKAQDKYLPAAGLLSNDYELKLVTDAEIGKRDYLKDMSLMVFGGPKENRLYWLTGQFFTKHIKITDSLIEVAGKQYDRKGTVAAVAVKNPHLPSKTFCLFIGDADKEQVLEAAKRLRYFTDWSYIVFSNGQADKGIFEGKKTLRHDFKTE